MKLHRIAIVIALLACIGCSNSDDDTAPDAGNGNGDADGSDGPFSVEMVTTVGTVTIGVTPSWSPIGAARFRELVDAGFYDEARFFRVVPGFVVQFGINGTPATQAMWTDRTIDDDPVVESNVRGYVTFAKSSLPNSRTTQLFINYSDNSFLDDSGFSPFGVVRSGGMDAIDDINSEYGEQPSQELITSQGNAYLDENFPNLDSITTARIAP